MRIEKRETGPEVFLRKGQGLEGPLHGAVEEF